MIEPGSGSGWSVYCLNLLQSLLAVFNSLKLGGTAIFPLFPSSFSSGGRFDCQEELATSFCHSVFGATEGRKLALLGAGAQTLRICIFRGNVLLGFLVLFFFFFLSLRAACDPRSLSVPQSVFQGHTCSKSQERVCVRHLPLACHIRPESWRPFVSRYPYG